MICHLDKYAQPVLVGGQGQNSNGESASKNLITKYIHKNNKSAHHELNMSDDPQKYIAAILELMAQKQFLPGNMDEMDRRELELSLGVRAGGLMTQYEKERQEADRLAPDDKRRKEFEKLEENLAKALPNITKGTLAAITAYQNGDAITGSAAVMDICASLAPMLGALSVAGGPPGMLVGAIFAMIGQILSFFAPKSESLTSQIENLLRELQAEKISQTIKAVHTNITAYATSLKDISGRIETALAPGLQIRVITQLIKDFNPIDGPTMTRFWEVAEWLQEEKNQDQDLWPTILAAICQAYTDLLVTVVMIVSLISTDSMRKRFDEADKLPEPEKEKVRDKLEEFLALGIARLIQYGAVNKANLEYLRRAVPAARDRGMLWQIDEARKKHLWAGTSIRKGEFVYLGGEQKRIGVAMTRQDMNTPNPTYHIIGLEPWIDDGWSGYDRTYHGVVKAPYKTIESVELNCDNFSLHALTDIWATPGAAHNDKTDILFYAAKDKDIRGFVLSKDNKVQQSYARVVKSKAISVRVVHHPSCVEGDPDIEPQVSGSTKIDYITYGGLEASPEIYVDAVGKEGYVRAPWESYSGLRVDQQYLWIFGSGGFACATHDSVMRGLKGDNLKPRWIIHYPNELLYDERYHRDQGKVRDRPPLRGLVDMCPCDDGTLAAALYTRSVRDRPPFGSSWPASGNPVYEFIDTNALYSAVHHIDIKSGSLSVEWSKLGPAKGIWVQKVPVFCWSMFESLTASLEKLGPALRSSR